MGRNFSSPPGSDVVPDGTGRRIGIVCARWNDVITRRLLQGATDTLALRGVEAQVRPEDEVHRVVAQPVLRQADVRAEAAELVAEVARLVDQTQGVHVPGGLHDAQVDLGQLAHSWPFQTTTRAQWGPVK